MEEQAHIDDQSHYEISLTAGQAFSAFVLLLLSLAASFAFGLMIGKGQADERLVVRKETPVVTEASLAPKKGEGRIVELGVADEDDFAEAATETAVASDVTTPAVPASDAAVEAVITESAPAAAATPAEPAPALETAAPKVPHFAQLFSTSDQKTAEAFAAKVIDRGFNSAYVERGATDKGPVFRVRVRFSSEGEARAAEPKLREFSKEVWITAK